MSIEYHELELVNYIKKERDLKFGGYKDRRVELRGGGGNCRVNMINYDQNICACMKF